MTSTFQSRSVEVEFVLPAYNEQSELPMAVRLLSRWLRENASYSWLITIADNASTDATPEVAARLAAADRDHVRVVHLDEKGRGRALRRVWTASQASVVAYMDVDLSTDLAQVNELIDPLLDGKADIAIGSRLLPGSHVTRCLKREVISRTYNLILRRSFDYDIADAQCGFKAMTSRAARAMLPSVVDEEWFFDTELLVLAYASGLELVQVPVTWKEDFGTTVDIPKTVSDDLAGIRRMRDELSCGTLPLDEIHAAGCHAAAAREQGVEVAWPFEDVETAGRPSAGGSPEPALAARVDAVPRARRLRVAYAASRATRSASYVAMPRYAQATAGSGAGRSRGE